MDITVVSEIYCNRVFSWAKPKLATITLDPAYNEKMKKKLLVINELFNIPVNDVVAKKSAHYSRVLVITELVVGGTQCINIFLFSRQIQCKDKGRWEHKINT